MVKAAEKKETTVLNIVKFIMLDLLMLAIWAVIWTETTATNGCLSNVMTCQLLEPLWTHIVNAISELTTAMVIVTETNNTKTVIENICTVWKLTCKIMDQPWKTATMESTFAMSTLIWMAVVKTVGSRVNGWRTIQTETSMSDHATLNAT